MSFPQISVPASIVPIQAVFHQKLSAKCFASQITSTFKKLASQEGRQYIEVVASVNGRRSYLHAQKAHYGSTDLVLAIDGDCWIDPDKECSSETIISVVYHPLPGETAGRPTISNVEKNLENFLTELLKNLSCS